MDKRNELSAPAFSLAILEAVSNRQLEIAEGATVRLDEGGKNVSGFLMSNIRQHTVWGMAIASLLFQGTAIAAHAGAIPSVEVTAGDLDSIESSPVLQQWRESPPDILKEIRNRPALPPRLRVGVVSNREWLFAIEDLTLYDRLILRGHYRSAFGDQSDREYGADLGYYLFPRGSYVNVSPQLGFRHLDLGDRINDGVNVGLIGTIALAPGGADLAIAYSFLDPFASDEATLGSVTAAYQLTRTVRLASQVNWRHTIAQDDVAIGLFLEVKLF